ncbi:ganglioside GM2 activator-like [Babylonia areolata]|uniref:ganglioside GM2 activator-like n=1 Tax=Babylonia areolata TaxID=304850 RepID=UPI003FD64AA4
MLRNVILIALLGVCYGSIFDKFSPLRKGIKRFEMDIPKETKKVDLGVSGQQADLLDKLNAALLVKGQPNGGSKLNLNSLLPLFGLHKPSGEAGHGNIQSFNIVNCSKEEAEKSTFIIESLKVTPDPVVLPGDLTFSFNIRVTKDIEEDFLVDLKLYKKMGSIDIPIPCIGEFGSCTYNVCDQLQQVVKCPQELEEHKINCKCPFYKNTYMEPGITASIDSPVFPEGDYKLSARMTAGGDFVGCYNATVTFG